MLFLPWDIVLDTEDVILFSVKSNSIPFYIFFTLFQFDSKYRSQQFC